MRKRFKHIEMVLAALCLAAASPVAVMADDTEQVQEVSAAEDPAPKSTETEAPAEEDAVTNVTQMIAALDGTEPTEEEVAAVKEAYEALTTAQKLQVENYDILAKAEEAYPENSGNESTNEDTEKQKNGTEYNFRISGYMKQLTLTLRMIVDADGDGTMDTPELTLTSPEGTAYVVGEKDDVISSDECSIDIIRTDNYIQLDVAEAAEGVWKVDTSTRVVFELSDYAGDQSVEEFEASDRADTDDSDEEETEKKGTSPVALVVFLAAVAGMFAVLKKVTSKTAGEKKKTKQDGSDVSMPRPLTPEEEIAKISEEWDRIRDQWEDREEDLPKPKEEHADTDENIAQTVEDYEEDDDLEEFDLGFFGRARFTKDDDEK